MSKIFIGYPDYFLSKGQHAPQMETEMTEATYQRKLINRLEVMFPGCHIIKNDPHVSQGIPDLLILWNERWAMLEVKISSGAKHQANQDYYVEAFNGMSFAAFICPQNEEQVLDDLQQAFGVDRKARVS